MGKKILVAIELDNFSANCVLSKATAVSNLEDHIEVVYVIAPSSIAYTADPTLMGTMYQRSVDTAMNHAGQRLRSICDKYDIPPARCHIRCGRVTHEIHALIREQTYDVLMIGSHCWSGWRRILGSHATSTLHGVPVDTWIFHVDAK